MFVIISSQVGANTQISPWLDISNPTLQKDYDIAAGDTFPSTVAGLGNRDCNNQTVTTRPARLIQSEITLSDCFVNTGFGIANSNGNIRFIGAKTAGRSVNFGVYLPGLIAIPNSNDVINYTSSPNGGLFLQFTRDLPTPINVSSSLTGEVTYSFKQLANLSLRDAANNASACVLS